MIKEKLINLLEEEGLNKYEVAIETRNGFYLSPVRVKEEILNGKNYVIIQCDKIIQLED